MPCHSCGRTDGTLHTRRWISARTVNKWSEQPTYDDVAELELSLCIDCLVRETVKGMRKPPIVIGIVVAVLTPLLYVEFCLQSALAWQVFGYTSIALLWMFVLAFFINHVRFARRWAATATATAVVASPRDARPLSSDNLFPAAEGGFHDYARRASKKAGRDALFSQETWRQTVADSVQRRKEHEAQFIRTVGGIAVEPVESSPTTAPIGRAGSGGTVGPGDDEQLLPQGALADAGLRRPAPPALGNPPRSEAEAVEALLSIYKANPDGFAPGYGDSTARERVREIGEDLNRQGGMEMMLRVHAEFERRTQVFGAARNLEHTWDQIGDWLG